MPYQKFRRSTHRVHGNVLIEYALPLVLLLTAGVVLLLTTGIPQAVAQFFSNSNNGLFGGGGVTLAAFGDDVRGGRSGTMGTSSFCTVEPCSSTEGGSEETSGSHGNGVPKTLQDVLDQLPDDNYFNDWIQQLANQGWRVGTTGDQFTVINPNDIQSTVDLFKQIQGQTTTFTLMLQHFTDVKGFDPITLVDRLGLANFTSESEYYMYMESQNPNFSNSWLEQALIHAYYAGGKTYTNFVNSVAFFQNNPNASQMIQIIQDEGISLINQGKGYSVYQSVFNPSTGVMTITNLVTGVATTQDLSGDISYSGISVDMLVAAGFTKNADGSYTQTSVSTGSTAIINGNAATICSQSATCTPQTGG